MPATRANPAGADGASPVWARRAAAPRGSGLDRDAIVAAAIRIADAEGLDAVSMRRVADELGSRPMTLYTHVSSKDDLLDLMFDRAAENARLGADLPTDWRAALRAIARRARSGGLQHPWGVDVLGRRAQLGPNTMRLLDEWIAAVEPLGVTPDQAWSIGTAVNDYVIGYTVRLTAQQRVVPTGRSEARRWQRDVAKYFGELADGGDVPHLEPLLRNGYGAAADNFEDGLDALIEGIANRYEKRGRRPR